MRWLLAWIDWRSRRLQAKAEWYRRLHRRLNTRQERDFGSWVGELKSLAVHRFGFASQQAFEELVVDEEWRNYYNQGYSPLDALTEDFSNAFGK